MPQAMRADAVRNRDRLVSAAAEMFGERGVDVPLDEVARRAGVSIGTLYNHFPNRGALLDAVLPERLAEFDRFAQSALADPDPWRGFTEFLDGVFVMQRGTAPSTTRFHEAPSAPSTWPRSVGAPGECWTR
jgi:AcrR family transcriptional regulator